LLLKEDKVCLYCFNCRIIPKTKNTRKTTKEIFTNKESNVTSKPVKHNPKISSCIMLILNFTLKIRSSKFLATDPAELKTIYCIIHVRSRRTIYEYVKSEIKDSI
jgi:hypothetical protein